MNKENKGFTVFLPLVDTKKVILKSVFDMEAQVSPSAESNEC